MPPKKKTKTPRKSQKGAGAIKDVLKFVRDNKLISKGLGMIPHPIAQVASKGASMVGLGKKKKKRAPKKQMQHSPIYWPLPLVPVRPPSAFPEPWLMDIPLIRLVLASSQIWVEASVTSLEV